MLIIEKKVNLTQKTEKIRVAVDTNMLLAVSQLKLDIVQEVQNKLGKVEMYVPALVRKELEKLGKEGNSHARVAALWLQLQEFKELEVWGEKSTDKALLALAKEGFIIATNDKELRQSIKNIQGKSIYIRKKKVLEFSAEF